MDRRAVMLILPLLVVFGGCTSADVEKVADDPQVASPLELARLIEEGTGDCDDPETPIAVVMPGLERAMRSIGDHQITITVLIDGRVAGRQGFTTQQTSVPFARLTGRNWVVIGHFDAVERVEQAIGGELEPELRSLQ